MKVHHQRIILYFVVFAAATIIRFILYSQTPYANGWDGYHYIMQIQSKIQEGHLHVEDSSLIFPYLIQFAKIFDDLILSYKVAISVLSGLFAVATVKLAANFTKEMWTLSIVGLWLIYSPTLTYLTAQFPKNLLGLVFFVLFLKYLIRQNYWLALLFFIHLFITHRMTAGLGVITAGAYFIFQMKPNTLKYIIPLGIAAIVAALYLPGVFHLSDLQRLSSSVFSSVQFPPYAFLQYIGEHNIHFFWLAEIIILVLVFLFLGYHIILRYLQKKPYLAFLYLFIPLFVLVLPFYSFQNAGIGYRFYLAFSVLAIPLFFFLKPLSNYKIKLPLICLIIAGGLLYSFDYEPETYSPPYDWYYTLVNELEERFYKELKISGSTDSMNQPLEKALRVAASFEISRLMLRDALNRIEEVA